MAQNYWTIGEINKVLVLLKEGLTTTAIAAQLGRTKNSVIGLLHRKKITMLAKSNKQMPLNEKPIEKKIPLPKVPATDDPPKVKFVVLSVQDKKGNDYGRVDFIKSRANQCKFIFGDPRVDRFVCGDPVIRSGVHWCEQHYDIVYAKGGTP